MQPAGLAVGAMFAIFLAVEVTAISQLTSHSIDDVFGLMTFLFVAFWALGWSVGVMILGVLTALFLFYKESARLQGNKLVHVTGAEDLVGREVIVRIDHAGPYALRGALIGA